MLIFTAEETRDLLGFKELIQSIRESFRSGATAPLRHHHKIENNLISDSILLLMPSWSSNKGFGGVKIVNVNPHNNTKNLPSISASYLLFDAESGEHLSLMDASILTSKRTAAASALAASYLARPDSSKLLIVGAGKVGSEIAPAFKTVLPIHDVYVWDQKQSQSEVLVHSLTDLGFNARVVKSIKEGVRLVDIISCATLAQDPIIKGEWLKPGQHVDLIGSFTPQMREVDDEALKRSKIFIDTKAATLESGELLIPLKAGVIEHSDIGPTLYDLCAQDSRQRDPSEITLFKGVGHAIEDLAAASLVYKSKLKSNN